MAAGALLQMRAQYDAMYKGGAAAAPGAAEPSVSHRASLGEPSGAYVESAADS
jgi:hypothetical protein